MKTNDQNTELLHELENSESWVKKIEPDLLKDFVTYWSIKKSPSCISTVLIEEIRNDDSNYWINLIESNHKFRTQYGDETAKELISIIETKKILF